MTDYKGMIEDARALSDDIPAADDVALMLDALADAVEALVAENEKLRAQRSDTHDMTYGFTRSQGRAGASAWQARHGQRQDAGGQVDVPETRSSTQP